ncbi:MAG TPA: SDR family oxidoreductase [Verrucomicrobiae bacterium]|nr:SDR family oxidoreductase [Verrucomicrobiae bacterium]
MPGRIVLITGVSRGLGRAMVDEFVRLGHTVLGCARSRKEIDRLHKKFPRPNDFYAVDIASDDEVKSWASLMLSAHGPPDLLLNNAGVINKNAPLWQISAQEFSKVIDVNVKGFANIIRHFAPAMVRKRSGVIVNFSSGWGRSTDAEVAPYCASKWAIEGLTLALAQELPAGLAAVSLNPGIINTDMLRSTFGSSASSYIQPQDWAAQAVPFLLELGPDDNGKQLDLPGVDANSAEP